MKSKFGIFMLVIVALCIPIFGADLPIIGTDDTMTKVEMNNLIARANTLYEDDTVFAYMSVADTTFIDSALVWYVVQGTFVNDFGEYWELGTTGIKRKSDAPTNKFQLLFMTGGTSDKAGDIKIGMVKNGTFVDGRLTTDSFLPGSGGKDFADTVGAPDGQVNPRCFWGGELVADDEITLVMTSTVADTEYLADGGSASAHVAR